MLVIISFFLFGIINCQAPTPICNNVPSDNSTSWPPIFIYSASGFNQPNVLHLEIDTTEVIGRTSQFDVNGITNGSCNLWIPTTSPGSCTVTNTLDLNWPIAVSKCGFTETSNGTIKIYTAVISVTFTENVEDVHGIVFQRTIYNEFNILIFFQNYATISTTLSVTSSILVGAVIISQGYNSIAPHQGAFVFETSVEYPYTLKLNEPGNLLDTYPSKLPATLYGPVTEETSTAPTQITLQTWKVLISTNESCTMNGIYGTTQGRFEVICIPGVPNCPTPIDTVTFSFSITSNNYCAQLGANVGVIPSLQSYSNSEMTLPSTYFLISNSAPQRAYFEVSAISSSVSVQNVTINEVILQSMYTGAKMLYQGGTILSPDGNNFGILVNGNQMSLLINHFFSVPQDLTSSVVILVNIEITYVGNSNKKRVMMELLQTDTSETTPSSSSCSFNVVQGSSTASLISGVSLIVTMVLSFLLA